MSKKELEEIIGLFPENTLEQLIIAGLNSLISENKLEHAGQILERMLSASCPENLRLKAAFAGIRLAVYGKDMPLAMRLYKEILAAGKDGPLQIRKAEALFTLSILYLPAEAIKLAGLWAECLEENPPYAAWLILARLGVMLCEHFASLNDAENSRKCAELLLEKISGEISGVNRARLEQYAAKDDQEL